LFNNSTRRRFLALMGAGAAGTAALATGVTLFGESSVPEADASSHREAPLISKDQVADNTDVYAFVSPDKQDTVTLIANYIPLQFPGGAPYYYNFGDDVLYEIKIDNNGDSKPEITYQFQFKTTIMNPNTFLYNTGPITSLDDPNWSYRQTYTLTMVDANGKSTELGSNLRVPPYNIGPKSTPNYEALANAAITALPSGQTVFAGPRADPFFVDVAALFDLLTIRKLPGNAGGGVNALAGMNVHSLILRVPKSQLQGPNDQIIGVWATASRRTTRVLRNTGERPEGSGDFVQVSRLGHPLVNEAVIPTGMKDRFNASQPSDDAQFLKAVQDPEAARLLNALYKINVPPAPRDDLVAIFLTGVPGATMPANVKPAEMLRLNMSVPVSATPNRMGVLGGDNQGFPNGRRLIDDVVDIELNALAGAAYPLFHKEFTPDPLAGKLGDGVDGPERPYLSSFPYVATPYQGFVRSAGIAIAPDAGVSPGAPSSGSGELGQSSSGSVVGNSGGAFAQYTITSPKGSTITLTLSSNAAAAGSANAVGLEAYQNGNRLGSSTTSGSNGQAVLSITPSATGGAVLIKVFNYAPGLTANFTLTQS